MGFLNRLFGYRWSLYIVINERQLCFVMHENSVVRLLGYVIGRFHEFGGPVPPWSLHLNFKREHRSIRLRREHFTADGEDLSALLINELREIDREFDSVAGGEPVLMEAATKKRIPIESPTASMSLEEKMRYYSVPSSERPVTLFSILDAVFGVVDEEEEQD